MSKELERLQKELRIVVIHHDAKAETLITEGKVKVNGQVVTRNKSVSLRHS